MTNETLTIIAFLIHSVLFAVFLFLAVINPELFKCQNYMNILYILLSTLLIHSGYNLGKKS
jgi:hypothetical protein